MVDVTVIGERDVIPAGFTCVDFTSDTRKFRYIIYNVVGGIISWQSGKNLAVGFIMLPFTNIRSSSMI